MAATVKVSSKNQIALPADVRRQLAIEPGDRLEVSVEDNRIVLERMPVDPLERLLNIAPEIWKGIDTQAYIDELRNEWSHREF